MKRLIAVLAVGVVCLLTTLIATRAEGPAGKPLKPFLPITGADSHVTKCRYQRIMSAGEWTRVWQEHLGDKPTGQYDHLLMPFPHVDFDKYMVIAIFQGESWSSRGLTDISISEEYDRIAFQFSNDWYQTVGGADKVTVYGFFAVPRSTKPLVVVEEMHYMGGPPDLVERITFPGLASSRGHPIPAEEKTWTAIAENGAKPGVAIVLTEKNGKVMSGRLHILDPAHPRDLSRGETCGLKIADQHGNVVKGDTSLIEGSRRRWTQDLHLTITLKGPFEGDRVQADVQKGDGAKQAAVFFRKAAKRPPQGVDKRD
jgi:hypothetical protein